MHILLVEDDAAEAQATMHAMREAAPHAEAHWAKDGEEALEFLFCRGRYAGRDVREAPALVLLDFKMPRLDGIEVLRRLQGSPAGAIPVVVLASSPEERNVLGSYQLGAAAFIVKPVGGAALRETLKSLV